MSRSVFAVLAGLALAAVTAHGQETAYKSSYYPLQVGATWTYKVTEKKDKSEQTVTVKVLKLEPVEVEGKPVAGARLEISSGDRKLSELVAVLTDGVYRFSSADKTITPPLCFLKIGAASAKPWQIDCTSDGTRLKGAFKLDKQTVAVPYFKAQPRETIVSKCEDFQVGTTKMSVTYWFADNIGIVKQHVQVGNFDQLLELIDYQPGGPAKTK